MITPIEVPYCGNTILVDLLKNRQRFGRLIRDYGGLGELRKQKKSPHKEVLYIFVYEPNKELALRSTNNSTAEQISASIRVVGEMATENRIARPDAEQLLDLLYAELQKKTCAT